MCTVQWPSLDAKKRKNSSFTKKISLVGSTPGVHNSNIMTGQKSFWPYPKAEMVCFYQFKRCIHQKITPKSTKFWTLRNKLKASAGHIWPTGHMFCTPMLNYAELVVIQIIHDTIGGKGGSTKFTSQPPAHYVKWEK